MRGRARVLTRAAEAHITLSLLSCFLRVFLCVCCVCARARPVRKKAAASRPLDEKKKHQSASRIGRVGVVRPPVGGAGALVALCPSKAIAKALSRFSPALSLARKNKSCRGAAGPLSPARLLKKKDLRLSTPTNLLLLGLLALSSRGSSTLSSRTLAALPGQGAVLLEHVDGLVDLGH